MHAALTVTMTILFALNSLLPWFLHNASLHPEELPQLSWHVFHLSLTSFSDSML